MNQGYVAGVPAPDGKELDAHALGVFKPLDRYEGTCIATIHRTDDDDDNLIVVEPGRDYNDDQIKIRSGGERYGLLRVPEV